MLLKAGKQTSTKIGFGSSLLPCSLAENSYLACWFLTVTISTGKYPKKCSTSWHIEKASSQLHPNWQLGSNAHVAHVFSSTLWTIGTVVMKTYEFGSSLSLNEVSLIEASTSLKLQCFALDVSERAISSMKHPMNDSEFACVQIWSLQRKWDWCLLLRSIRPRHSRNNYEKLAPTFMNEY